MNAFICIKKCKTFSNWEVKVKFNRKSFGLIAEDNKWMFVWLNWDCDNLAENRILQLNCFHVFNNDWSETVGKCLW